MAPATKTAPRAAAAATAEPRPQPQPRNLARDRSKKLRIIPLGGLGEIGMNMMVFDYGDDMFVVDVGHTFPDDDLLGVDLVIPDINYVLENRARFRAIILTPGHEDHIGALPYLLRHVDVPIYGSPLTLAFVRERLKEHGLDRKARLTVVDPEQIIKIGAVEVQFISVTHSIPDAYAIAMRFPFGVIIHTGDYKIDQTPMDGRPFDFHTFARYGDEGVLALMADSTNVEREGSTKSERTIIPAIDRIIREAPRSVIFSCFSSSLHRMQIVLNAAKKHNKKVFLSGLNMIRNVRIGAEVGVLHYPPGLVYDSRDIKGTPPEQRVILTTGSQGEPMSALSRIALDEHQSVKVKAGDVVVLSSRIIPGNEKAIYRMINHFFRRGAEVIYQDVCDDVHVSGHAQRDEMRTMLALTRPKYLIPVHGEFRHLVEHKHLGVEMGVDPEKCFVMLDGDVIEMDADGAARGTKIPISRILVDGNEIGGIDEVVLRDRRHLAEDGMVTVIMAIEKSTGTLVSGPDIVSRGFLHVDENEEFFERAKEKVLEAFNASEVESREEWAVVKTTVRTVMKKFIKAETGRFPVILPVVLEI